MKTDIKGCSTCNAGTEHAEEFYVRGLRRVQYDYRTPGGKLFSCVANNIDAAHVKRDRWLAELGEDK